MSLATAAPLTSAIAAPEQTLQSVEPGNGEELVAPPAQVVLTFAADVPADATATVTAPDGEVAAPVVGVEGRELLVEVPDAGPGQYEVQYTLGNLTGSTGFVVLVPGQAPEPEPTGSLGTLVSVAIGVALLAVLVMTVLRWRRG